MSPTRSAFLSTFSLALTWSGKWPQVTRWKRGSFSVVWPSRLAVYHQLMLQLCFVNSSCFHGNQCLSWLETMHSDKVNLPLTTTRYHYHHHIQCTPIKWIYHSLSHVTITITVSNAFRSSEFVTYYHALPLQSLYPMHSDQVNLSLTTTHYHYHQHIQCILIKWTYHSLPHVTITITVSLINTIPKLVTSKLKALRAWALVDNPPFFKIAPTPHPSLMAAHMEKDIRSLIHAADKFCD